MLSALKLISELFWHIDVQYHNLVLQACNDKKGKKIHNVCTC